MDGESEKAVIWFFLATLLAAVAGARWLAPERSEDTYASPSARRRLNRNQERAVILFLILILGWAATAGVSAFQVNRAAAEIFAQLDERGDEYDCFVTDDGRDRCVDGDDRRGFFASGFYVFVFLPALTILGFAALFGRRWGFMAALGAVWWMSPMALLFAVLDRQFLSVFNAVGILAIIVFAWRGAPKRTNRTSAPTPATPA